MEHIKVCIKDYGIDNWEECDICEHMFRPDRIRIEYSNYLNRPYNICDEC